jgi:pimeloyl-ACP methyl ester carboxylesterase
MEETNSDSASINRPKSPNHLVLRLALGISAFLVVGYLGISAYAGHTLSMPNRVFDPSKASTFTVPPQEVEFRTSDNLQIRGWFIPAKKTDKVLILVHGLNSSRTLELAGKFPEFGSALNQRGFSILMIDLRGHGQSASSRFTFGITERRDVIAAVEWLKTKGFKPQKIGVLGVSMGSAAVIGAAADDSDIGAVVTDSGYAEVYPVIQKHWRSASGLPEIFLPSTMLFGHLLTGHDPIASKPVQEISRIAPRPVLIIHSTIDPYTPVENAYRLREAYPLAEYWETNAKQHPESYNTNPKMYVDKVTDFYNRSLK